MSKDSRATVDMNFVMTGSGKFVEVQGPAESAPFTKRGLDRMAEIALQRIRLASRLWRASTPVG